MKQRLFDVHEGFDRRLLEVSAEHGLHRSLEFHDGEGFRLLVGLSGRLLKLFLHFVPIGFLSGLANFVPHCEVLNSHCLLHVLKLFIE